MQHKIKGNKLIITIDKNEGAELKELFKDRGVIEAEFDIIDELVSNTELDIITASETGDMTNAPMLGILGGEEIREDSGGNYGVIATGHDEGGGWFRPIDNRWAFMDYQVRSFVEDLIDNGTAIFTQ